MRRVVTVVALAVLVLATGPGGAQPVQKIKLGALKLTSSAVLFIGVEKGYFREFGIEPELVYFQAAQPIAVALASGDIDVGATGLTAGLYNIVAGGVRIWIVADKGREWPDHNLTSLVVRKDLYDSGVRTLRELKGKKIGVTQIGSTFHYNIRRSTTRSRRSAWTPSPPPSPSSRGWRRAAPGASSSTPATRSPGRSPRSCTRTSSPGTARAGSPS